MATKKYLSLERLTEYDALLKTKIDNGDSNTLTSSKSYTDAEIAKIKNGTITVSKAESADVATNAGHATTADSATNAGHANTADSATTAGSASTAANAEKLGGQSPSYYAKASDIPTGALAKKDIVAESDLDSALAEKVNAAAEGNHSHSNKSVLDGITSAKVTAWDNAEANAKAYADGAAAQVKNDLLNGAGDAYDTLKELGDLIVDNADAIEALESIASGKADKEHDHAIEDVTGLQDALNGKADASHGAHVEFDGTNKPKMDGTAAFGTSTKVARADHVHPTDTSRAAKSDFDSHAADTTKHITADERTAWNAAKTHADSAHAPSDAQKNIIESVKVNGTALTVTNKAVNITVPTKASDITAAEAQHTHAISEITNLSTTLTNASNAITANTNSINAHTDRIVALENKVGDGFAEITSAEIQALFA